MSRGKLIAIEGIDGAGKSNLAHALTERLPAYNVQPERMGRLLMPELTAMWNRLVSADLITQRQAATLAAADLTAGCVRRIAPALEAGRWVVVDGYVYSHRIRYSMRGVANSELDALFQDYIEPDLICHLRIPLVDALARIRPRGHLDLWTTGMDTREESIGVAWQRRRAIPQTEMEAAFLSWQAQAQARFPATLPLERTITLPGKESSDALVEAVLAALELG